MEGVANQYDQVMVQQQKYKLVVILSPMEEEGNR